MGPSGSCINNANSKSFLEACRMGNIEQVHQLWPLMTYKEINCTDINGNTGLHLACMQNNYDLVRLLLQTNNGNVFCSRTISNKQGLNAYECAQSERIRLLFARPISTENPFVDTNHGANIYQIKSVSGTRSTRYETKIPKDWNHGYTDKENATDAQFLLAISRSSWLLRRLFRLRTESDACEVVRNLIRRSTKDAKTYKKCFKHFELFMETKNPDHLLTLYTDSLDLCKILQKENNAFTVLLYLHLNSLVNRTFDKGETFRGMSFTDLTQYQAAIKDYHWAKQNDNYVLETRVFQSTSTDKTVAKIFIDSWKQPGQTIFSILCRYQFPNKCFTAIDLTKISTFSDEREVLILPFTLFKVTNIEQITSHEHSITLLNIPVPDTSLRKVRRT